MKKIFLLIAVITFASTAQQSNADKSSNAYLKAVESGNTEDIVRTQSYLSPPYCYDYNPWHGVTFIKAINGRVVKPSYPFIYQDMAHLKVRKLYDRVGIGEMKEKSNSELELIQHISDWANKQWGHMQPLPYPTWDALEILDKVEKGDAFWCTFKSALFVQACNAAGLTGRILGINPRHKAAHTTTEVYSNEYRKWMLVDPWLNGYFERDGIPLSALEYHNAFGNTEGIYVVFGENGRGTEYWDYKTGKAETIPHANARTPLKDDPSKGYINFYYDYRIVLRNDHTVHPQSKENVYLDGFMVPYNARGGEWWGPQLHWIDDKTMPQITCLNSGEVNDFQWPLNEIKVDLTKISTVGEPVVLEAKLSTFTPNFSHYNLVIGGKTVSVDSDTYIWKLNKGINSLKINSMNDAGMNGFPSEFVIEYDQFKFDYSKQVTVELKNPGMESASDTSGGVIKPANWGTITSNAFRFKDFTLDSKVKHSGKYSLKATTARDPQSGIDYAFIVKSQNFEVNAGTDVIYSIWLRASQDDTPVDIALLESKYKGLGTYVERVKVGEKWGKYELKCRLHSEINSVYVSFKVYKGTVWADDADIVEKKRFEIDNRKLKVENNTREIRVMTR